MTEIIQQAISKVDKEGEQIGGQRGQLLASHVIDRYLKSDANAQRVMDKNLKDFFKDVTKKAQKQANQGFAMISDETVYGWLAEFYGFGETRPDSDVINLFDLL